MMIRYGYNCLAFVLVDRLGTKLEPGTLFEEERDDGPLKLMDATAPHKESSSGRVWVEHVGEGWTREYFPHVFDARWERYTCPDCDATTGFEDNGCLPDSEDFSILCTSCGYSHDPNFG